MQRTFIGMLLIITVVVLFAIKNAQSVFIDFWLTGFNANLSVVLIVSFTVGAVISYLLSIPYRNRKLKKQKVQADKIQFLENELSQMAHKMQPEDEPEKEEETL